MIGIADLAANDCFRRVAAVHSHRGEGPLTAHERPWDAASVQNSRLVQGSRLWPDLMAASVRTLDLR
jgi:hypothetical protein